MLLLDTNALMWLATDNRRLGRRALSHIKRSMPDRIAVSTLTWWEFGMAVNRPKVRLRQGLAAVRSRLLALGLREEVVTTEIVLDALDLGALPGDPIDRIIVATARTLGATLVTSDQKILDWPGKLDRLDAQS